MLCFFPENSRGISVLVGDIFGPSPYVKVISVCVCVCDTQTFAVLPSVLYFQRTVVPESTVIEEHILVFVAHWKA